jgi:hypothetical protein
LLLQASLDSYTQAFNGIVQWKEERAGAGARCLKAAVAALEASKRAGNAFDRAPPQTLGQAHARFDDVSLAAWSAWTGLRRRVHSQVHLRWGCAGVYCL